MSDLLDIDDLRVRFAAEDGRAVHALNGVSLRLREGEVLGILGESGCGKSTLAKSLLRVLPRNAEICGGRIAFEGRDLLGLTHAQMNEVRGARLALIAQEPGLALNPVMKVGEQIGEVVRAHRDWNAARRCAYVEELLGRLLPTGEGVGRRSMYDAYPHQLSGGQQQRVVIGQALACEPSLIVADEPTASLDTATEAGILELFRELKAERRMALILITHDPGILHGLADRVAVMYAGRVVEEGPAERILTRARHPYVRALLACAPAEDGGRAAGGRLGTIAGAPPDLRELATGCNFFERCGERLEKCAGARPAAKRVEEDGRVECFLYE